MIKESLGFFACILILTLIGLGPALWLVSAGQKRVAYALGIAPALGNVIILLIAFPLARYLAPVQVWAFPVTAGLALISLGLAAGDWRRNREDYWALHDWLRILAGGAWVLVACLILAGPLIARGMQYAAYRGNPHDTFLMISVSESLRVVKWHTLVEGAVFTPANLEQVRRLAEASPAGPFAAKAIPVPLSLNYPAAVSWAASILGLPVYRFYHAHHLMSLALALPSTLVIGDRLRLPRLLKYLAAAAIPLGFWAKFVLEGDAGYEITAIPVTLLVVFAWIQLEHAPAGWMSRSRLLLAVGLAAMWALYFPVVPVLAIAFGCYYGLGWLQRVRPLSAGLWHSLTAALVVFILLLSGQIDFLLRNTLYLIGRVNAEAQYPPLVLWLIKANDISAVWGLPGSILWGEVGALNVRWLLQNLAGGLGVFLTAALAVTAVLVVKKSAPVAERIIFAVLVGGAVLAMASGALSGSRNAGKAFTYVFPYLILSISIFPNYAREVLNPPWDRLASAMVAVWLATQFGLGLVLPYDDRVLAAELGKPKAETYDLSPITRYLDAHLPEQLLVVIPRAGVWSGAESNPHAPEAWTFAYYSLLAFSPYRPYYQSGLIVDNSYQAQNLWLQELTRPPDYAVILKSVDYLGQAGLGTKVAETPDLALYHLTSGELSFFKQAERRIFLERERETECYEGLCSPPGL